MAKEWGVTHDKDGYANCYELDCDGLRILDLNDPQYCILRWMAVLLENRAFDVPFAQDFINGTISYRLLNNAMHLGKLGQQFVLKSKKAFERIRFVGYEIAEHEQWYAIQRSRALHCNAEDLIEPVE